jgi:hypothetical protein
MTTAGVKLGGSVEGVIEGPIVITYDAAPPATTTIAPDSLSSPTSAPTNVSPAENTLRIEESNDTTPATLEIRKPFYDFADVHNKWPVKQRAACTLGQKVLGKYSVWWPG